MGQREEVKDRRQLLVTAVKSDSSNQVILTWQRSFKLYVNGPSSIYSSYAGRNKCNITESLDMKSTDDTFTTRSLSFHVSVPQLHLRFRIFLFIFLNCPQIGLFSPVLGNS